MIMLYSELGGDAAPGLSGTARWSSAPPDRTPTADGGGVIAAFAAPAAPAAAPAAAARRKVLVRRDDLDPAARVAEMAATRRARGGRAAAAMDRATPSFMEEALEFTPIRAPCAGGKAAPEELALEHAALTRARAPAARRRPGEKPPTALGGTPSTAWSSFLAARPVEAAAPSAAEAPPPHAAEAAPPSKLAEVPGLHDLPSRCATASGRASSSWWSVWSPRRSERRDLIESPRSRPHGRESSFSRSSSLLHVCKCPTVQC